ncbi:MAG: malate synthase G, partial [Planktomarina sp.]|nr:malate synthase G [Planktomarina sp.]
MLHQTSVAGMSVAEELFDFIESRVLPGLSVTSDQFWTGLSKLTHELGPKNRALLAERETMQAKIDQWHINNRGEKHDPVKYRAFLTEIDYIVAEPDEFEISTKNVDPEIASIPGPQLVVPIMNARYALNAANARWGSLYDAMYGTNAIGDLPLSAVYNAARGKRVIAWTKDYLDRVVPLAQGSHAKVDRYKIINDELAPALAYPEQYVGMNQNDKGELTEIFLQKNGLHIIIKVDACGKIGAVDTADVDDISLESAVSVIMDCEDSVAAVDATDKVLAYKNWLGLMRGDLKERVTKSDKIFDRVLNNDLFYTKSGKNLKLKGRALMLIRNVGHLMTIPAVIDRDGFEIGEGLLDAICTTLIAMHDLDQCKRNSLYGSIYVVKPKMHGPAEVAFADEIFTAVERMLGLAQNTVKLGIMDEERRTSVNLKACIYEAKHRVAFINTGFLDRTGDEIHTSMEAGPMVPKGQMKLSPWINAYEDRNVDIGLACGLQGKAQIGKGMWAMPDLMSEMLVQKVGHPKSGATCAWVPSPTAATLHATHYHEVDVLEVQRNIKAKGPRWGLKELLTIPLAQGSNWSPDELMQEVENNAQGILGYVVRWVDNGIGCSKVPDIHDVGLMEDRATCRISSQALANWLHHGVIDREMVMAAMKKMASVVDGQNVD